MPTITNAPALKFALIFTVKIILFSLLYWSIFLIRPDSFNFSNGYNSQPLSSYIDVFFEADDPSALYSLDFQSAINQFQKETLELNTRYQDSLASAEKRNAAESTFDNLYGVLNNERSKGIDDYHFKYITPLEEENNEIDRKIETGQYSHEKIIDMRMLALKNTEKILEHHTYIVENFTDFVSDDLKERIRNEDTKLQNLKTEYREAETSYRDQRSKVYKSFGEARSIILKQVAFMDFLYFSACISTTTTFGDITANNRLVRLIVVFQIFAGIFILAMLIQSAISSRSREAKPK